MAQVRKSKPISNYLNSSIGPITKEEDKLIPYSVFLTKKQLIDLKLLREAVCNSSKAKASISDIIRYAINQFLETMKD